MFFPNSASLLNAESHARWAVEQQHASSGLFVHRDGGTEETY